MRISHVLMPVTGPGLCQVICAFTSCTVTLCGSGCAAFPTLFTLILEHWSPESTGQAVCGVWPFPGFQQHQDSQDISSFPLLSRRLVDTSTAVVMCRMKLGIFPLPWKPVLVVCSSLLSPTSVFVPTIVSSSPPFQSLSLMSETEEIRV